MDLIEIRPGMRRSSLPTQQPPAAHLSNYALDSVPSMTFQARYLTSQRIQSQILSKAAADMWWRVLPKCRQVLYITNGRFQSSSKGHVHIEAYTCSTAHLQQAYVQDSVTLSPEM